MNPRTPCALALLIPMAAALLAGTPASRPADPTMDWLLNQATTSPASDATQPAATTAPSVFTPNDNDDSRQATLLTSNGEHITGRFTTTPNSPIRIYDNAEKKYHDIPFKLIKSLEAHVLWERLEQEWKFKNTGSDEKEYSGKTYPARETEYTMTLTNGQQITGAVAAPLYLQTKQGSTLFVIHKRDKGDPGQSLQDLTYIQRIDFKDN